MREWTQLRARGNETLQCSGISSIVSGCHFNVSQTCGRGDDGLIVLRQLVPFCLVDQEEQRGGAFPPPGIVVIGRDLVEAAYTLGASDGGIIRRVLLPSSAPEIAEILRLVLGWAWTYVIVAELIGSSSGIGHMITDSQALLNTGQIIFGIIIIGLIGLFSDFLFKAFNAWLFPWKLA